MHTRIHPIREIKQIVAYIVVIRFKINNLSCGSTSIKKDMQAAVSIIPKLPVPLFEKT
jgi:hypothetical protein